MQICWELSVVLLVCSAYLVGSGLAVESPRYTVVRSESDFEIRLYAESTWATAFVRGDSFGNSTRSGFHRLYQYIHGANRNATHYAMTAPVVTTITPQTNSSNYLIRTYITDESPPQPNSELNVQIDKWRSHCVVVRKFPGFARDDNIKKEFEALVSSLNITGATISIDRSSYSVAQYNASHHLTGRLNEVWINVTTKGCPSY